VFDVLGVRILADRAAARRAGRIVMDELGFLETGAPRFQAAVMDCLDGDVPILGVIKPDRTPFLDRVRAHKAVHLIEVTLENRAALTDELTTLTFRDV
jgi:nucleoside-triphosphatase